MGIGREEDLDLKAIKGGRRPLDKNGKLLYVDVDDSGILKVIDHEGNASALITEDTLPEVDVWTASQGAGKLIVANNIFTDLSSPWGIGLNGTTIYDTSNQMPPGYSFTFQADTNNGNRMLLWTTNTGPKTPLFSIGFIGLSSSQAWTNSAFDFGLSWHNQLTATTYVIPFFPTKEPDGAGGFSYNFQSPPVPAAFAYFYTRDSANISKIDVAYMWVKFEGLM